LTSFGWIEVHEQVWWCDGRIARSFCRRAAVKSRGSSRRVQRALTDFGADEAFAQAAVKFKEHYGVEVSVDRARRTTLAHAARMAAQTPPPSRALPGQGVDVLLAEADGCMVPTVAIVDAPPGADRRQHRQIEWKEIRLVAARGRDSAQAYYAATMNGVEAAGDLWENVARAAGRGLNTRVHGVGDGALWIAGQCLRRFGPLVSYLLDLFHVCDYLALVWPGERTTVQACRDHLKAGALDQVLDALRQRLESPDLPDEKAPARCALRYLQNRSDQLDYPAALRAGLPVGSGLIESGNRHVLQRRLKLAGAWWLPANVDLMAHLRTTRANGSFDLYWSRN
jgi:hypothetical protein